MPDETFSPAELMIAYCERKGWGHPSNAREAMETIEEREPALGEHLRASMTHDHLVDFWPEFLEEPPSMFAAYENDSLRVGLTEHGQRLADRYIKEVGE